MFYTYVRFLILQILLTAVVVAIKDGSIKRIFTEDELSG